MKREPRIRGMRRLFRLPGRRVQDDVDEEIAFHVDSRARALVAQGWSETDARHLAEREYGDRVESRRELAAVDRRRRRREWTRHLIDTALQDLRYAARALRRSPSFTITATLTLAIGIAASVAIFAVVNGVLLQPLPFRDPARLVGAWHDFPTLGMTHGQQSAATFFTYRTQARSIEGIALYEPEEASVDTREPTAAPRRLATASVSATLFPVLGVTALRGRVLTDDDDHPSSPPVVVISEQLWRTALGSDPRVIGRTLDVNGRRRQIVGVMPAGFRFPSSETALWVPLGLDPADPPGTAFAYNGVARLKKGVTLADAQRDFTAVLPRIVDLYPLFVAGISTSEMMKQVRPRPVLTPFRDDLTGAVAGTLWMIAAAAGLLLIVACVNVANLTLVRTDARRRENAIRAAIGAGTARVIRYQFAECITVATVAGALGLGAAWALIDALRATVLHGLPRGEEIRLDWRALLFAAAVVAVAALVSTAISATRVPGSAMLRESARGSTTRQHRLRSSLVAAQLSFGLVALAASGLLFRSFTALHAVRPGFDAEHVETLWISLPRVRYASDSSAVRFYSTLVDRAAAIPGVTNVAIASRLPLEVRGIDPNPVYPEDDPSYAHKLPPLMLFTSVGGDYFHAMRVPLLVGHVFDRMGAQREGDAIISASAARIFWKDSTGVAALGKRFRTLPTSPPYTVVGVVADAHDTSLAVAPSPTIYFPETARADSIPSHVVRTMALVVRTTGDPAAVAAAAIRIVRGLDPTLPVFDARPLRSVFRDATARLAFTISVLGAAAVVTLLLGAVGLYGVMAYVVALRRRELGIRIALGASPRRVALDTTRQGIALTGAGVLAGFALFALAARFVRTLLFGVAPWDPVTLIGASLALIALAAVATWVPARRASRVDPAEALRAE